MITALYVGFYTIIFFVLSTLVMRKRRELKIAIGSNGNEELERLISAHNNFMQYSIFMIMLLFFAEMEEILNPLMVHLFGVIFLVGRLLHFFSIAKFEAAKTPKTLKDAKAAVNNKFIFRVIAMQITFFCLIALAALLIINWLLQL